MVDRPTDRIKASAVVHVTASLDRVAPSPVSLESKAVESSDMILDTLDDFQDVTEGTSRTHVAPGPVPR